MLESDKMKTVEVAAAEVHVAHSVGASSVTKWLKAYWAIFPLLLLVADFYWILWGNLAAIVLGIVLLGIVGIDVLILKSAAIVTLRRYWPVIAVLAIISLSMYIRLFGYFTPDGGTRWPYLRNIDSYYFLRHTETMQLNNGIFPTHDNLILAPLGVDYGPGWWLYMYLSFYLFSFVNFFVGTTLPYFMAWFSALLASLIAIPAYFAAKCLFDRKAGILASLFMILTTPFMSRSLGGDPDSDSIVMLMTIISIALFLILYKRRNKENILAKKNILLAVLMGLSLALFAYSWAGYWLPFWIVGSFIIIKIIADFLLHRKHKEDHMRAVWKHTKSLVALSLLALVVFWIITVPDFGIHFAGDFVTTPLGAVFGGGYKGETGQFPNVLVSVAEAQAGGDARNVAVQAAGLDTAAGISGLPMALLTIVSPFLLTLACFVYLGYSYYKRREHLDTLLFMGIWFFGFLFASTIAVRFTIFLAPVYAICSGIMLAKLWRVATGEDRSLGA